MPTIPDSELVNKKPTSLIITEVAAQGYRGETVNVDGILTSGGVGIPGQMINIFLQAVGSADSVRVGYTNTGSDGSFSAKISIPVDFALDAYEVFASTPGTDEFAPFVTD